MGVPVFVRSLIFTIIAPPTIAGWIPYWLAHSGLDNKLIGKSPSALVTDILGMVLIVVGGGIYIWCAYDFTFIGRGTPAVFDPPKQLVVRGLYKYVRNPMYIGILTALLGQVLVYGSPTVLFYTVAWAAIFSAFSVLYEEPHLYKKFGNDYVAYTLRVNRWFPKF